MNAKTSFTIVFWTNREELWCARIEFTDPLAKLEPYVPSKQVRIETGPQPTQLEAFNAALRLREFFGAEGSHGKSG